jgi:hypothetical protein
LERPWVTNLTRKKNAAEPRFNPKKYEFKFLQQKNEIQKLDSEEMIIYPFVRKPTKVVIEHLVGGIPTPLQNMS